MEWHVWDFPDNIRVYFKDEFREWLFKRLKEICGSRYRLAKILNLHPMTIKQYELGHSTYNLSVYVPVSFVKRIIHIFKGLFTDDILSNLEKNIVAYRIRAGWPVYNPILPIKERPEIYSIIGHLLGDGCASKNSLPFYCNKCEELISGFRNSLKVFGRVEIKLFIRKDGVKYLSFPTVIARILQHIFNIKFTHPDSLPERLFKTTSENKAAFIRAFYDDEGCVSKKIYITQKSKHLLKQLKDLLLSMDIKTGKIYKKRTAHQFIILTESYENFQNLIPFTHPKKSKRLIEMMNRRRLKPIPLKHKVLQLITKEPSITKYYVVEKFGVNKNAAIEALLSLKEEGKITGEYTGWQRPYLWYPTKSNV